MPTTSSQPASPLDDCQGEQGEIFAPSSDSREPIGDLLAAKMGMRLYLEKIQLPMSLLQTWFACEEARGLEGPTTF